MTVYGSGALLPFEGTFGRFLPVSLYRGKIKRVFCLMF